MFYGMARRQSTDKFKREAVGLLASSGRPLSRIAGELGISAARLRANRRRMALFGHRARSLQQEDRWMGNARTHAGGTGYRGPDDHGIQRQKPPPDQFTTPIVRVSGLVAPGRPRLSQR